jgi:hypothetical protein
MDTPYEKEEEEEEKRRRPLTVCVCVYRSSDCRGDRGVEGVPISQQPGQYHVQYESKKEFRKFVCKKKLEGGISQILLLLYYV